MKKLLLLLLFWLGYNSSYAQVNTTNNTTDSQPITKTGIELPQLITTDLNRSDLQFGLNLSEGLTEPNLSANYQKFISDKNKQLSVTSSLQINHFLSFQNDDFRDFYTFNNISASLGADLKLFNDKNYFLQIGTQNFASKIESITQSDFFTSTNAITLGVGKGRIDFVNDGSAALIIIEKLSKYGVLKRDLTEEEYTLLTQRIRELKNRRRFVNRSYPLTETEEIQDLLFSLGLIDQGFGVIEIINDAYKYEPMINRTTGSQFRVGVLGSYIYSNFFTNFNVKSISASASYMIDSPINSKWQYNKGVTGYISLTQAGGFNTTSNDDEFDRLGVSLKNDLHYLVDTRIRVSFLSIIGYDFRNNFYLTSPIGYPIIDNNGVYLNLRPELEYQISRIISATIGINLELRKESTFTGLYLGLNF